jgi:hypothetical protein
MNRLKPLIRKTFSISLPIAKILLHKASKVFVQQSPAATLVSLLFQTLARPWEEQAGSICRPRFGHLSNSW